MTLAQWVHINFARYSEERCRVFACPVCKRRRRMLARFQEWYGLTVTCTGCGDTWTDGELHPRPFAPRWRQKAIERAKKRLRELRGAA